MATIPSTIANAATRAERAAGRRRLQICIAAGFAGHLPRQEEVVLEVGEHRCRASLQRRRDTGAAILSDFATCGPGEIDLAAILAEMGLGVGDHPALEVAGTDGIRLTAAEANWGGL